MNKTDEKKKRGWWWWILILLILFAIISLNEKEEYNNCVDDCDWDREDCRLDAQYYDGIS